MKERNKVLSREVQNDTFDQLKLEVLKNELLDERMKSENLEVKIKIVEGEIINLLQQTKLSK